MTYSNSINHSGTYSDGCLDLDFSTGRVRLNRRPLVLTRKEFELLSLLVHRAGDIITRRALLEQVWGYGPQIRTRTLDVHIRRLRKKLGIYSENTIETIFGVGYRFQPFPVQAPALFEPSAYALVTSA